MKPSRLPRTDSIKKLAEFWDSHDLTDFEEELEVVTAPVFMRRAATARQTLDKAPQPDLEKRQEAEKE